MMQMKKKVLAGIIVGLVSASALAADGDSGTSTSTSTSTSASTVVNGGTIHFKGEVVNAACSVDAGSADQTVQLGQVRTAKLAKQGDTSSSVGFNIKLNDCDTNVAKTASVAFAGPTIASNDNVLSAQSDGASAATNVGIQVMDSKGSTVKFDGSTFSSAVSLTDGSNTLPFQARYYATGQSTPGVANADATFKIQYQ